MKIRCRTCGEIQQVGITRQSYNLWQAGELLQNAAPYLSTNDAEILISGTCEPCFDAMFDVVFPED